MTDAAIVFKSEVFYGDRFEVLVTIDNITNIGFDIYYLFRNGKNGKDVAHVKTGMVFFNYDLRKLESTPDNFYNKFSL